MATWNGSILTLNNDVLGSGVGIYNSMTNVSTDFGTVFVAGKRFIVTSWNLALDTASASVRVLFGYSALNTGAAATYFAVGRASDGAGLSFPCVSPAGTYIEFPSGKAFFIAVSAPVSMSGLIAITQI